MFHTKHDKSSVKGVCELVNHLERSTGMKIVSSD